MAEFDAAGFSAVDDFFGSGGAASSEETSKLVVHQKSTNKSHQGLKKRQGVGSVKSLSTTDSNNAELSKRLLRVGRKRTGDDDDNEEDENPSDDQSDDEEEDMGRTGITPSNKNSEVAKTQNIDLGHQVAVETKKLGKKERKRRKLEEEAAAAKKKKNSNSGNSGEEKEETDAKHQNSGGKRKRKKVRSRQKNIRKDNRSTEEKPVHLVPGESNYQGRPLTEETRRKLNLPPPSSTMKQHFVIDRTPVDTQEGTQLAVDQFLADDPPVEKPTIEKVKKNKKGKKKRKYKNLAL